MIRLLPAWILFYAGMAKDSFQPDVGEGTVDPVGGTRKP
jgi:hypothetical protein